MRKVSGDEYSARGAGEEGGGSPRESEHPAYEPAHNNQWQYKQNKHSSKH